MATATRPHVLLYTLILLAVSMLPFATRMSGLIYLAAALALGAVFVWYAVRIYVDYSGRLAQQTFRYSIVTCLRRLQHCWWITTGE